MGASDLESRSEKCECRVGVCFRIREEDCCLLASVMVLVMVMPMLLLVVVVVVLLTEGKAEIARQSERESE